MRGVGSTSVGYDHWGSFQGWSLAPGFLAGLVARHGAQTLLEVGSGANPTLAGHPAARGLRYITTDADGDELAKASPELEARRLDLEGADMPADLLGSCDLVFSRMVNEHIRDGERYHANIRRLLRPGGIAAHCFATLYAPPFAINALLPDSLAGRILDLIAPRDRFRNDKFEAHYSWCRGPTRGMIERFRRIGYQVVSYDGFFGHGYYRNLPGPLHRMSQALSRRLAAHPIPQLCSYATVVLRRVDR